jgi:two-component system OmpR family sensor kinase
LIKRWWVTIPLLAGLLAFLALQIWNGLPNPAYYLQIDLGTLAFAFGAGLSLLTGLVLFIRKGIEDSLREQARKSAEERRRFLGRLDHELKNPLTAILAGLANLSSTALPDGAAESLANVKTQVNRVRQLVDELRKLSDLETRPLDLSPVDVPELLQACYTLAGDQPGASQRTFAMSIPQAPWPLPKVMGDQDLLMLAIHNLLSNAIKFTQPGDRIELRALEDGNQVVLEIADTGPGIPDQERPLVWEELYRGVGARGIEGSGLGLSLVKAILTRHQGQIELRSRPGEGTVFTIRLPAVR